jgi:hypothetical protein
LVLAQTVPHTLEAAATDTASTTYRPEPGVAVTVNEDRSTVEAAFAVAGAAAEDVCRGLGSSAAARRAAEAIAKAALKGSVEVVTRSPTVSTGCVAAMAGANLTATTVAEAASRAVLGASCTCSSINRGVLNRLESNSAFSQLERKYVMASLVV